MSTKLINYLFKNNYKYSNSELFCIYLGLLAIIEWFYILFNYILI